MKNEFEVITVTLNPAIDRTVTISNFTAGAVNRVEQVRNNPGGKGVNVASALADYGVRVAVTGFLGRDNSASFEELFSRKNIEDHFVRIAGQTRVGIKVTDPVLRQTTDINFPGPTPGAGDLETLLRRLATMEGTWFAIAGSLPPGVEAGVYKEMIAALRARGNKAPLDASGEALRLAIQAEPNIVKPNIHELEALLGRSLHGEKEVIEAAREIVGGGIELAAISMGRDGACFVTEDEVVIARPPEIEVKSTVGAGDAMVAGILAAHLRQLPLDECARLSTAFSLEALTRLEPGISSAASLESSLSRVTINHPQPYPP